MRNKLIITGVLGVTVMGGLYLGIDTQPTYQKVGWDKPTTDAEWAEDTKNENIAERSTAVLNQMIESHTNKLARQEKAFAKYTEVEGKGINPVDYLYVEWRQGLEQSYPNEPKSWWESEAQKQAQEQYDRELWEIEKIRQSLERMDKEIELRDKGFVVVEGEIEEGVFGANVPPERVRHIID